MKFLFFQMKQACLSVFFVLLFLIGAKPVFAQFMFQPLTHVSAFYMNGECAQSKIKIQISIPRKE
jgi:hypothetical protein